MRKPFPALALAALACLAALSGNAPLAAQALGPDRPEIEALKDRPVVFVNYEGPQTRIDSLDAIRGIGSALGRAVGAPGRPTRAGEAARYQVIRAVDPALKTGFDADILVLGADARIDHVRNLRWVIAGYLEAAWGYARADAYTLATFVTVYNAVYRGDLEGLAKRYKPVVMRELSQADAGLSTRYSEWPGRSRILIPLSSGAKPGALGAVDTGAVSGKEVVQNLREEPGKAIDERQALVDLKEREAAEKQAAADAAKAKAAADEAALAAEKDKVAADRAALEADKAAAAEAGGDATAAGGAQEASLATREEEVAKAEAEVASKEAAVAAAREEAAATEGAAAAKQAEVATDRAGITEDQKAAIAEEVAAKAAAASGIYLFEVVDTAYPFARIIRVDPATGKRLGASTLNAIRGRALEDAGDSWVAVAGKEGGTGAVRLVKLAKPSLEVTAQGATDIFAESGLWRIGSSYYAVAKAADGKHYLARFGADLAELARSKDAVNPFTFVTEVEGGLAVQGAGGGFLLLAAESLEKTRQLTP